MDKIPSNQMTLPPHFDVSVFILCAFIGLFLYGHTLSAPFILDDRSNISSNPQIRLEKLTLDDLRQAGFNSPLSRRPVAYISFALNYYLGGYHVSGYHLVNILIHILAGIFLFHFLKDTLKLRSYTPESAAWIAFAAALIWLVHPLQTQSVTYIVQRMNSMAAMFYLLSLLFYVRGRMVQRQPGGVSAFGRRAWLLFAGSAAAGMLALGTKEITATLPFFILLYEWYFFQDLSRQWLRRHVWAIAGVLAALGVIALLYLGDSPLDRISAGYGRRDFSMGQRVMTQWRVVVFYLSLLLYPHPSRLNLEHDFSLSHSLTAPATTLASLLFLVVLLAAAVVLARRQRLVSFCLLWVLGNLAIESSVIGLELVFEHRMYLPSMLAVAAVVVTSWRYVRPKWTATVVLCAAVAVFSLWTYQRNQVWQDEISLLTDCVNKSPQKVRPLYNLGIAWAEKGSSKKAIDYYRRALAINHNLASIHTNLAIELFQLGHAREAFAHYQKALQIKPDFFYAHHHFGISLARRGEFEAALVHLEKALRVKPGSIQTHQQMAGILLQQNQVKEAIHHYRQVLKLDPASAETYNNIGVALIRTGRIDAAITAFKKALDIRPDFKDARLNLNLAMGQRSNRQ